MRGFAAGLLVGFILAAFCLGAVSTFSQVSGRGTYSSGYLVLPRCQSDMNGAEFGSMCADEATGDMLVYGKGGLRAITTQVVIP